MNFGKRLANLREKNDWSQDKISKKLNISQQSYSKYETNRNEPDMKTIVNISKLFNVSTDYLLGLTKFKEPVNDLMKNPTNSEIIDHIDQLSDENIQKAIEYIELLLKTQEK